jgi:conjugal transfer pilus assembly protein TrbC
MNKPTISAIALSVALAAGLGYQLAQAQMPSDEALNKAMQAAQKRAGSVLGEAEQQALPNNVTMPRTLPNIAGQAGVDPAKLAEQYKKMGKAEDTEAPQLMVFVSLSMPEAALKRIGEQARKAGAVLVFRGLKYGLRKGGWNDSLNALKPLATTGADIQIHPELFTRFNVTVVPTLVVTSSPKTGCQDDACAAKAASVVGDVTMDYALDQLTGRKDAIGEIARERRQRL